VAQVVRTAEAEHWLLKIHDYIAAHSPVNAFNVVKAQITLRIDEMTIEYFRALSEPTGIHYQALIKLYLLDFASQRRKLSVEWRVPA
jgi:predicted DNA binding CopG/RHH family protein